MKYTRTSVSAQSPVTVDDLRNQMRITSTYEDALHNGYASAVGLEIEDLCGLALLPQTIIATSDPCPGTTIELPVGPVADNTGMTVLALAEDGTTATVTAWWLEAGRYPVLHLTDTPAHRIRVTYPASLASGPDALPYDLRHAIATQVCRMDVNRGDEDVKGPALSPQTARVIARYRRPRI